LTAANFAYELFNSSLAVRQTLELLEDHRDRDRVGRDRVGRDRRAALLRFE